MKNILLFGAGKSASVLIKFLIKLCIDRSWKLTICDKDVELIKSKADITNVVQIMSLDIRHEEKRLSLVKDADIVISLLPVNLHILIAKDCKNASKNLLTASYLDHDILAFKQEIEDKKLLFLYEMGLDPGIDHMSAMHLINSIKEDGGNITSFISHCGGLVAPVNDNNPWHYKISWNPRNIVTAGKDGAVYKEHEKIITVPYNNIFKNNKELQIDRLPILSWYANRDSNRYIELYDLHNVNTFIRTTLRYPSFCRGWSRLVDLGLTSLDDYLQIKDCTTFNEWFTVKKALFTENEIKKNSYLNIFDEDFNKEEFDKQVSFLGLQSKEKIGVDFNCSADILQYLLENKLYLLPDEKDMIVMIHEVEYEKNRTKYKVTSSLIVEGKNSLETAMAKTVGLPLGIVTKLILDGIINEKGLKIPIYKAIYEPVLNELVSYGIKFQETVRSINQ